MQTALYTGALTLGPERHIQQSFIMQAPHIQREVREGAVRLGAPRNYSPFDDGHYLIMTSMTPALL